MANESLSNSIEDLSIPALHGVDFYLSPDIFSNTTTTTSQSASNSKETPDKKQSKSLKNLHGTNIQSHDTNAVNMDFLSSPSKFWNSDNELDKSYSLLQQIKHEEKSSSSQSQELKLNFDETFLKSVSSKSGFPKKSSKKPPQFCPQCKSKYSEDRPLRYFQVSLDHSIQLCSSEKCTYPFDTPNETLSIQNHSVEDVLKSQIDFDINNVSLDSREIEEQLTQLQSLVPTFIDAIDNLKRDYCRLESGKYNVHDHQGEDNEHLVNIINHAFDTDKKENSEPLKPEMKPNISVDEFVDTQNEENVQDMLSAFI